MSFLCDVTGKLEWKWDSGALDTSKLKYTKTLKDGYDDNEAEAIWHDEDCSLLEGAKRTLDFTVLTRTVLGDSLAVTFTSIKAILIVNTGTASGAGTLRVGNADTAPFKGGFEKASQVTDVPPDSPLLLANRQAGWDVSDASKQLKLSAAGGDVTYSIAIVGTTSAKGAGSAS